MLYIMTIKDMNKFTRRKGKFARNMFIHRKI